jgi:hypothetical protein
MNNLVLIIIHFYLVDGGFIIVVHMSLSTVNTIRRREIMALYGIIQLQETTYILTVRK